MNYIKKLSDCDPDQIIKYTYDETKNASRVTLVGLDNITVEPKIDLQPIVDQIKQTQQMNSQEEIKIVEIKVPIPVIETKIEKIEVPTIIVQEKIIERPVEKVIIQEKINNIDVPVVIKETQYKEIQIPVITERLKEDKVLKIFQVIQSLAVLGILIKLLMK
jgi:hypothetical protein